MKKHRCQDGMKKGVIKRDNTCKRSGRGIHRVSKCLTKREVIKMRKRGRREGAI